MLFVMSRDFGAFLAGLVVLPALLLATLACMAIAWRAGRHRRPLAIASALVLGAPLAWLVASQGRDRVLFAAWAATHTGQFRASSGIDGVIADWDRWGIAGLENDAYLVSDTHDALASATGRRDWLLRTHQRCEIVASRRMWRRIDRVTTANCSFDRPPRAG